MLVAQTQEVVDLRRQLDAIRVGEAGVLGVDGGTHLRLCVGPLRAVLLFCFCLLT